jgi:hypothetical protein
MEDSLFQKKIPFSNEKGIDEFTAKTTVYFAYNTSFTSLITSV